MKKTGIAVLAAAAALCLALMGTEGTALAAEQQPRLAEMFDEADLFTVQEEGDLLEEAQEAARRTETEVVFLTYDDARGKSTEDYTDDFCDEKKPGYDPADREGAFIMLALDMDNRMIFVKTGGTAIDRVGDGEVEEIVDQVYRRMPAEGESYYAAASAFVDEAVTALESSGAPGAASGPMENPAVRILLRALLAVLIGAGATAILLAGRKTGKGAGTAAYMGSEPRVVRRSDRFINTTVVKTRIQNENHSGGGSGGGSSHVSSGGRSYGGGGRSF